MQMKRKFLAPSTASASGTDASVFRYEEQSDGSIRIMGFEDKSNFPKVCTIPEQINGKPVTEIGDEAFIGCRSLTSVVIPEGVTAIGGGHFVNAVA